MDKGNTGLILEGLTKRLEALERDNAELRHKVATLVEASGTPRDYAGASPALDGRVSRRQLLSRVGAAAAGLVVAGALTQRDIREAKAAIAKTSNDATIPAVKGTLARRRRAQVLPRRHNWLRVGRRRCSAAS